MSTLRPMTSLDSSQLALYLQHAIKAAAEASEMIMSLYQQPHATHSKSTNECTPYSIVTEADLQSQNVLQSHLSLYSDIRLISEEQPYPQNDSSDYAYSWVIDPLDNTWGFEQQEGRFAVSIGLVERTGKSVLGVVQFPANGGVFHSIHQSACMHNGQPIQCVNADTPEWINLKKKDHDREPRLMQQIFDALNEDQPLAPLSVQYTYGGVYNVCQLITNGPGCVLRLPRDEEGACVWDYAGTACLLESAGGWISDLEGNPLELNRKNTPYIYHKGLICASSASIAQRVLQIFSSL